MIKANEAKAMVEANIQKDKEALQKNIEKFLEEKCEPAILAAVEKRICNAFVELPEELDNHSSQVCANLTANGYKSQIRFGTVNAILIMW